MHALSLSAPIAYVLSVVAAVGWLGQAWGGFPVVTSTVGDVWPRPQNVQFQNTYLTVTKDAFT